MSRLHKWASAVAFALGALFVALMAGAFARYPGGTWEDAHSKGASLLANYFCDVLRPVALNGEPNPGASPARLGLYALAIALLPFFFAAPSTFTERPALGRAVRITGAICGIAGIAVVAVPSYVIGKLGHGLIVLCAAGPGLAAALICTLAQLKGAGPARRAGYAALATLSFTALATAIFVRQLIIGTETTPGLAALQKLAALGAVAWFGLTALALFKR